MPPIQGGGVPAWTALTAKEVLLEPNRVVHVHIPGDFEGEIHLYVGPSGVEMAPAGSNGSVSTEASPVERILERLAA